jgi:predicted enzyme related to lactoylglutathione lyase
VVRSTDDPVTPTKLAVFSLSKACTYYASVFDAKFGDLSNDVCRPMQIGADSYVLEQSKSDTGASQLLAVEVDDVDVVVARAAAKGGSIISTAKPHEKYGKMGEVRYPFGHSWRVSLPTAAGQSCGGLKLISLNILI